MNYLGINPSHGVSVSLNFHGDLASSTLEDAIYTFKNCGPRYLYTNDEFLIQK